MTLVDDIDEMVGGAGDIAGVRITAWYRPVGGRSAKVSPPRYVDTDSGYIYEKRYRSDGELGKVVLLDSIQAQANHCEEALHGLAGQGRTFAGSTGPAPIAASSPCPGPSTASSLPDLRVRQVSPARSPQSARGDPRRRRP